MRGMGFLQGKVQKMKKILLLLIIIILLSSFSLAIPNPAAKFCKEQGNSYEIRKDRIR